VVMDMTRLRSYYPVAAERFVAVGWGISTPRSEVLAMSVEIAIVRVREDGSLVITHQGGQKVIQDGEVLRLNRQTGALRIMERAEFEETHREAVQ
jgi:predicted transcriptional regulator